MYASPSHLLDTRIVCQGALLHSCLYSYSSDCNGQAEYAEICACLLMQMVESPAFYVDEHLKWECHVFSFYMK
jgi:hypothetical protein